MNESLLMLRPSEIQVGRIHWNSKRSLALALIKQAMKTRSRPEKNTSSINNDLLSRAQPWVVVLAYSLSSKKTASLWANNMSPTHWISSLKREWHQQLIARFEIKVYVKIRPWNLLQQKLNPWLNQFSLSTCYKLFLRKIILITNEEMYRSNT